MCENLRPVICVVAEVKCGINIGLNKLTPRGEQTQPFRELLDRVNNVKVEGSLQFPGVYIESMVAQIQGTRPSPRQLSLQCSDTGRLDRPYPEGLLNSVLRHKVPFR